jgi:hypothetical protein
LSLFDWNSQIIKLGPFFEGGHCECLSKEFQNPGCAARFGKSRPFIAPSCTLWNSRVKICTDGVASLAMSS